MEHGRMYALISNQGTACDETALCAKHLTPENKSKIEARIDRSNLEAPIPGTWTDCSSNDALACIVC